MALGRGMLLLSILSSKGQDPGKGSCSVVSHSATCSRGTENIGDSGQPGQPRALSRLLTSKSIKCTSWYEKSPIKDIWGKLTMNQYIWFWKTVVLSIDNSLWMVGKYLYFSDVVVKMPVSMIYFEMVQPKGKTCGYICIHIFVSQIWKNLAVLQFFKLGGGIWMISDSVFLYIWNFSKWIVNKGQGTCSFLFSQRGGSAWKHSPARQLFGSTGWCSIFHHAVIDQPR